VYPYDDDAYDGDDAAFGASPIPNLSAPQFFAKGAAPVGTATGPQAMLPPSAAALAVQRSHDAAVAAARAAVAKANFGSFTSSPQAQALYVANWDKLGLDQSIIDPTLKWAAKTLQLDPAYQWAGASETAPPETLASLGRIWDTAEASAPTDGSVSTSSVLVGAISKFGMSELRSVLSTLVSDIITFIAQLLAEEGLVTFATAATIGAAGGYIGELVALIVAAIIDVANLISGGPTVTITNGKVVHVKDYAGTNLQNAITWFKNATAGQAMSLTPKCVADTFGLFLANPVWLYQNQKALGIHQPLPPDYGTGSVVDTAYQQLPGAYELTNRFQFMLAASMVLTAPAQLPSFATRLSDHNAVKNTIDQTITNYKPFFTMTTSVGSVNAGVKDIRTPAWAPGVADWSLPKRAPSSLDSAAGIPNASGTVYTGCPNLLTNDNVITPSGQGIAATAISPVDGSTITLPVPNKGATIKGQTAPAADAFFLQHLFPALSDYQCRQLISASFVGYNQVMSRVRKWLVTQSTLPTAASLAPFNLTADDEAGAIALWHALHPTVPKPAPTPTVARAPKPAPLPAVRFTPPAAPAPRPVPIIPAHAVELDFFHSPGPKRNEAVAAGVVGGLLLGVAAKAKLASLFVVAPVAVAGGALVTALVWKLRR
jgi:hypothetical protein